MAEAFQNLIGPQVRKFRVEAGLSQEAFATRLQVKGWDISRGGLSKIEARLRRVTDAELWMLSKALSKSVDELFPARPKDLERVLRQG